MADSQNLQHARAVRRLMSEGLSKNEARAQLGLGPVSGGDTHHRHQKRAKARSTQMVVAQPAPVVVQVQRPRRAPRKQVQQIQYVQVPAPKHRRHHTDGGNNVIVPTDDGGDITTRRGLHLHASFPGHEVVEFDRVAIGAVISGMINQLRNGSSVLVETVFPELYPLQAAELAKRKNMADERAIGSEVAKLLGVALRAYQITPSEWAAFYQSAWNSAAPQPVFTAETQGGFASPLAGPSFVTSPFGNR